MPRRKAILPSDLLARAKAGQGAKTVALISLAGVLLIYVLRLNRVFGLFVDDAWYLMLAKALASGQGYHLTNSPTPGIVPLYPPGFPFLLSLVYRLSPDFHHNIRLLKAVSIGAMVIAGIVAFCYFRRSRLLPAWLAWGIAMVVVLNPPLVFLATSSLMSECFFTLAFLLAIAVIERGAKESERRRSLLYLLGGAALAAGAVMIRAAAFSLVAATPVYLFGVRRWRMAAVFTVVVMVLCAPWMIYSNEHGPTLTQKKEQGGPMMRPYTEQFWDKQAGDPRVGRITVVDLPMRVGANLLQIAGRDTLRIFATSLFEFLADPNKGTRRETQSPPPRHGLWPSFILTLLVVLGFIGTVAAKVTLAEVAVLFSLATIVLWPFETFRFVLPLTPFLVFYLLTGCQMIGRLLSKRRPGGPPTWIGTSVIGLLIVMAVSTHVNQLLDRGERTDPWLFAFDESERMMDFINRTLPEGGIAAPNPAFVHLYTNRPTVEAGNIAGNLENWRRLGVRYIARTAVPGIDTARPERSGFQVVYHSRGFWLVDLATPAGQGR